MQIYLLDISLILRFMKKALSKNYLIKRFELVAGVVLGPVDRVPKGEDENNQISMIAVDNFFTSFCFIEECFFLCFLFIFFVSGPFN